MPQPRAWGLHWSGCNEEQWSSNSPPWSASLWSWRRSNWLLLRRSLEEISVALLRLSSPLTLWCLQTRGLHRDSHVAPPLWSGLWDSTPQKALLWRVRQLFSPPCKHDQARCSTHSRLKPDLKLDLFFHGRPELVQMGFVFLGEFIFQFFFYLQLILLASYISFNYVQISWCFCSIRIKIAV